MNGGALFLSLEVCDTPYLQKATGSPISSNMTMGLPPGYNNGAAGPVVMNDTKLDAPE